MRSLWWSYRARWRCRYFTSIYDGSCWLPLCGLLLSQCSPAEFLWISLDGIGWCILLDLSYFPSDYQTGTGPGDQRMLCWVQKLVDGVPNGLGAIQRRMLEGVCLAETVTLSGPWFQTAKRSQCLCGCGCDGLPSLEISLESVESHADTTEHTAEPY